MKRKVIALVLALTMGIAVLTGCSSASDETKSTKGTTGDAVNDTTGGAANGGTTTIKILSAMELVDEEMMDTFMSENPDIKVEYEYIASGDYSAKFSALAASNEIPDVFWTQAGYYTDQINEGLLMDLSKELDNKAYEGDVTWRDTFIPTLLENFEKIALAGCGELDSYDYGIPFTMTTVAVMYNKTIYNELGLKVPTTWTEFMSNNEAIKNAGYTAVSVQNDTCIDWFPRLFWDQFCRDEIENKGLSFSDGTMTFETESVKKGMESFKELWDKGYLPENFITANLETTQQMFIQGKLVQVLIAPDKIQYLMENAADGAEYATFALPGIAGETSRSLGGSSNIFAISSTTEKPEAAIRLLKYITSRTNFETDEGLQYSNSGLVGVERGSELDGVLSGFADAAAGGFCPDIYVPTTISTEIKTAFKSDVIPNYLMDVYSLSDVSAILQSLYNDYLASLK
ncbi:MAG TPA: extracellular solute-binding protein [Clostridiales bacterium]|nr:extracellular solute-binding protein [Clostridiales bacterium]